MNEFDRLTAVNIKLIRDNCRLREQMSEQVEVITQLRSMLGATGDAKLYVAFKQAWNMHPGTVKMLEMLYKRDGRPVSKAALVACANIRGGCSPKLAEIRIFQIRKELGWDAVSTIHSLGYRLTPKGMDLCREALAA